MKIAVVAATNLELSALIEIPGCRFDHKPMGFNIYRLNRRKTAVFIVESGPGPANAAAAATLAIERFSPDHVLNTGICGVYSGDIRLLASAVAGSRAVFADAGVESQAGYLDLSAIDLPLYCGETEVFNRLALDDTPVARSVLRCVFLSLSAVSGDSVRADTVKNRFDAKDLLMCEDMESASVALVAARAGVPCTIVRGISNLCGDRNYHHWKIREAAASAQQTVLETIDHMISGREAG